MRLQQRFPRPLKLTWPIRTSRCWPGSSASIGWCRTTTCSSSLRGRVRRRELEAPARPVRGALRDRDRRGPDFDLLAAHAQGHPRTLRAPRRQGDLDALYRLPTNAMVGIRGPYGNGFPVEEMEGQRPADHRRRPGNGPLRSLLWYALDHREKFRNSHPDVRRQEPRRTCSSARSCFRWPRWRT